VTQDRPDAAELLEAVAEYLLAELRPEVPREQRFRVLVAANVCVVVARELRAGEEPLREDLAMLSELLGRKEPDPKLEGDELEQEVREAQRELAERLRAGDLDDRLDELSEQLREHVRRKLEVARPGYDRE
jgi:Domain of unknown function (DUF6285)